MIYLYDLNILNIYDLHILNIYDLVLVCGLWHINHCRYYLPTPPLGQDMTQGQFLSGV